MIDLSVAQNLTEYKPANKVRFVTAASLFDGHDASINIMRRILMANGAEVIHLGHNRSVEEIVTAALQEDAQGIAISSYQGGHVEYFKYMIDLLKQRGGAHIKVFGGGGGVIVPPVGWLKAMRQACDELDILLVADEVITAFGRMGKWTGAEFFGVVPDIMNTATPPGRTMPRDSPLGRAERAQDRVGFGARG